MDTIQLPLALQFVPKKQPRGKPRLNLKSDAEVEAIRAEAEQHFNPEARPRRRSRNDRFAFRWGLNRPPAVIISGPGLESNHEAA